MRNRRLVKVAGVLCGLALLAAACGDDDDDASADTTDDHRRQRRRRRRARRRQGHHPGSGDHRRGARRSRPGWTRTPRRPASTSTTPTPTAPRPTTPRSSSPWPPRSAGDDGSAARRRDRQRHQGRREVQHLRRLPGARRGRHRHRLRGRLRPHRHVRQRRADRRLVRRAGLRRRQPARPRAGDLPDRRGQRGVRGHGRSTRSTVERAGDGVLTIGTLLPETGNLAFLGPPEIAGVQMAVAEINEAGGFNGSRRRARRGRLRRHHHRHRRPDGHPPARSRTSTPSSAPPAPACRPA